MNVRIVNRLSFLTIVAVAVSPGIALDAALDEFRIKRQDVFEFAEPPRLSRDGDDVTIRFAVKDYCDVTVAIEERGGRIVRHLASGVLGDNAPQPFQKDSLAQTVVWDGKDELGHYVDRKDDLVVRVSLGLKPRFERTLNWAPERRAGSGAGMGANSKSTHPVPLMAPTPEGMYVFEGWGNDHLRLFDHDGNYVRTIYPFPADKIDGVRGIERAVFPQDGLELPIKIGYQQATLLNSGTTASLGHGTSRHGTAATAMAIRNGRIALVHESFNRLATDGSTGGLPLAGPKVSFPGQLSRVSKRSVIDVSPTSAAFSPDGKYLYLTGYLWRAGTAVNHTYKDGLHGVVRMDFEGGEEPEVFAGSMTQGESGSGENRFTDPVSVACDSRGRVYVADFMNDRIQVFEPDGTFYKSLRTSKPARVTVHPETGEIHVYSWAIQNDNTLGKRKNIGEIKPTLTIYGPIDDPKRRTSAAIPFVDYRGEYHQHDNWGGFQFSAMLDPWANPPALWVVSGKTKVDYISAGGMTVMEKSEWERWNISVYSLEGDRLDLKRDFSDVVSRAGVRHDPPSYQRQRLYVNPKTGKLYIGETPLGKIKSFSEMTEIDPDTGRARTIQLPFNTEDVAFDMHGMIYMRSMFELARYDTSSDPWREVPFDYGEERPSMGYPTPADGRRENETTVSSAIPLYTGTMWHKGGLWVSPKGHIAISCYSTKDLMPSFDLRTDEEKLGEGPGDPKEGRKIVRGNVYVPRFFPGRNYYGQIHVFNRHGELVHEDEVPGIAITDGLFIDQDDSIYVMAGSTRIIDGKPYFSDFTGTLMKFRSGKGRIESLSGRAPVPMKNPPNRPPDIQGTVQGKAWVTDAEWFYGGVGFAGRAAGAKRMSGITCACNNSRFAFDYFARSFAPEFDRYKVAVLDTNGNLILRLGRYGNVDDGTPLIPEGGPAETRPLGGDEIALFHPLYLATQTDERLFIADPGNQRVVSVRLEYHANHTVPLRAAEESALSNEK